MISEGGGVEFSLLSRLGSSNCNYFYRNNDRLVNLSRVYISFLNNKLRYTIVLYLNIEYKGRFYG